MEVLKFFIAVVLVNVGKSDEITVEGAIDLSGSPVKGSLIFTTCDNIAKGEGQFASVVIVTSGAGNYFAIKFPRSDSQRAINVKTMKNEFRAYHHLHKKLGELKIEPVGVATLFYRGFVYDGVFPCRTKTFVLVMEYIPQNLTQYRNLLEDLQPHKFMRYEEIVEFSIQILKILNLFKQCNLVHRDLKPDNFMVKEDGTLRIIDFGFALFAGSKLAFREVAGTPLYMNAKDMTSYTSPKFRIDLAGLVTIILEFGIGFKSLAEKIEALMTGNGIEMSEIQKFRKIEAAKLRLKEVIHEVYGGIPDFEQILLEMDNDTQSDAEINYDKYIGQLKSLNHVGE